MFNMTPIWYAKRLSGLWRWLNDRGSFITAEDVVGLGISVERLAYCVSKSKPFYTQNPRIKMELINPFTALDAMRHAYNVQHTPFLGENCNWNLVFSALSRWDRKYLAKTIENMSDNDFITVYRGVASQENVAGFSWTNDKRLAKDWAGFKGGFVVRGTVDREHILFCETEVSPLTSSYYSNGVIVWPASSVTNIVKITT